MSEPFTEGKQRKVQVRCECGTEKSVRVSDLKSGDSRSCGCLNREQSTKHGGRQTRLYGTWVRMIQRCINPNNKRYKYYGGRGISVCDEWRSSFANFRDWAKSTGYKDHLTLDRVNNDKGYWPENCRFVTQVVQCQNRRMLSSNTSGYIGVSYHRRCKKWQAEASHQGHRAYLGLFDTVIEAAIARDAYVRKYYESPVLNFPQEVAV